MRTAPHDHDYEPGETTHAMHSDPDCRVCGGPPHRAGLR